MTARADQLSLCGDLFAPSFAAAAQRRLELAPLPDTERSRAFVERAAEALPGNAPAYLPSDVERFRGECAESARGRVRWVRLLVGRYGWREPSAVIRGE